MLILSAPSRGFFIMTVSKVVWSGENLYLLGKITDKELAERMNISQFSVIKKRLFYGIAPCEREKKPTVEWTDEILAQVGIISDTELARLTGISQKRIMLKRREMGMPTAVNRWKTPENLAKLGTMPDIKLAEELGVSPTSIQKARRQKGIAPYNQSI